MTSLNSTSYDSDASVQILQSVSAPSHPSQIDERNAFSVHINNSLSLDPELSNYLPLNIQTNDLYSALHDGILLCKLLNRASPGIINERALNKREDMNVFQKTENLNIALTAARHIGCHVVNIGSSDIIAGRQILILGLVWQIIKIELLSRVSLDRLPHLKHRLVDIGGTDDCQYTSEVVLMRWVNYHLKQHRSERYLTNFSSDLADCEIYLSLFQEIDPNSTPLDPCVTNPYDRAELLLIQAEAYGVAIFITPTDITKGNSKLNLSFLAQIFDASAEPSNLAEQVKRDSERVWPPVLMDWQPGLGLPAGVVGRAGRRGGRDTSPVPSTSSVSSAAPVAAPRRGSVAISVPAAVGYTSTTTVAGSVPPSEAGEELPLLSYCSSTLTTVGAALVGGVESVLAGLSGGIINTAGAESVEPEPEPTPDHELKRWVNWQLRKASNDLQLRDFGLDLKDSDVYISLLLSLDKQGACKPMSLSLGPMTKAYNVIKNAKALGLRPAIQAKDIIEGNKDANIQFIKDLMELQKTLGLYEDPPVDFDCVSSNSMNSMNSRDGSSPYKDATGSWVGGGMPEEKKDVIQAEEPAQGQRGVYDKDKLRRVLRWINGTIGRLSNSQGGVADLSDDLSDGRLLSELVDGLDLLSDALTTGASTLAQAKSNATKLLRAFKAVGVKTFVIVDDIMRNDGWLNTMLLLDIYDGLQSSYPMVHSGSASEQSSLQIGSNSTPVRDSEHMREGGLIKWVNYNLIKAHLGRAGEVSDGRQPPPQINDIGENLKDLIVYSILIAFACNEFQPLDKSAEILSAIDIILTLRTIMDLDEPLSPDQLENGDLNAAVVVLSCLRDFEIALRKKKAYVEEQSRRLDVALSESMSAGQSSAKKNQQIASVDNIDGRATSSSRRSSSPSSIPRLSSSSSSSPGPVSTRSREAWASPRASSPSSYTTPSHSKIPRRRPSLSGAGVDMGMGSGMGIGGLDSIGGNIDRGAGAAADAVTPSTSRQVGQSLGRSGSNNRGSNHKNPTGEQQQQSRGLLPQQQMKHIQLRGSTPTKLVTSVSRGPRQSSSSSPHPGRPTVTSLSSPSSLDERSSVMSDISGVSSLTTSIASLSVTRTRKAATPVQQRTSSAPSSSAASRATSTGATRGGAMVTVQRRGSTPTKASVVPCNAVTGTPAGSRASTPKKVVMSSTSRPMSSSIGPTATGSTSVRSLSATPQRNPSTATSSPLRPQAITHTSTPSTIQLRYSGSAPPPTASTFSTPLSKTGAMDDTRLSNSFSSSRTASRSSLTAATASSSRRALTPTSASMDKRKYGPVASPTVGVSLSPALTRSAMTVSTASQAAAAAVQLAEAALTLTLSNRDSGPVTAGNGASRLVPATGSTNNATVSYQRSSMISTTNSSSANSSRAGQAAASSSRPTSSTPTKLARPSSTATPGRLSSSTCASSTALSGRSTTPSSSSSATPQGHRCSTPTGTSSSSSSSSFYKPTASSRAFVSSRSSTPTNGNAASVSAPITLSGLTALSDVLARSSSSSTRNGSRPGSVTDNSYSREPKTNHNMKPSEAPQSARKGSMTKVPVASL